ncbi:class II fructose-bisphosphate aldolase [Deinococcus misasensis]|uniref:class II fructose-bisphosphate aldolase n=1 Tax=Deinococcus misasensis TaxID=392413 RepID=UPI000550FAD9|nr:class II fructose-bisphosphate aldolase [Deinococcus misasensis]
MKIPDSLNLNGILPHAQQHGYGVAAFSARYLACIRPVMEAAQEQRSPVIIEISQRELGWFQVTPLEFRNALAQVVEDLNVTVPFCLHLDHSWDLQVIQSAIDAGFNSVMIDASAQPFEENVRLTRQVVEMARPEGVSVEAELGKLTTTDRMESENDEEMYTDPLEAGHFVAETGCDALAVSIGTAHGVYPVKNPKIDFERLRLIRAQVGSLPIVLHGGSGLPAETVHQAMQIPGGGTTKMNIATDLEVALLTAMGGLPRMTSAELDSVDPVLKARGLKAVKDTATDKILHFVRSGNRAWDTH